MPVKPYLPVFEEGTVVRIKRVPSQTPNELISKFGVVVIPNKYGFFAVGVDFMEWSGGHTLGGHIQTKSGWYILPGDLELTNYQRSTTSEDELTTRAAA